MSWAIRRRIAYLTGIFLFFAVVVGGPVAYHFLTIAPTCHDGIQNQNETSPDHGGPCLILDATSLQPTAVLWARTLKVRDGLYDAVAYVQNSNPGAGVLSAPYELDLTDSQNILVAEVTGEAFIMPGGITPVFVGGIDTGHRDAVHAQFSFTQPLTWERVVGIQAGISISNQQYSSSASSSSVTANAQNISTSDITDLLFVATVFDQAGNAIASSQTALPRLDTGQVQQIFFTWPSAFTAQIGRIDIIPVVSPVPDQTAER